MLQLRSVRLILAVLLLAGAAAVVWNYVSRRATAPLTKTPELLGSGDVRSLKDAVYQERKTGRLRFEVRADLSVEMSSGVLSLKNVHLVRYDEQGKPTNLVSGRQGLYDTRGKKINFSGDVQLRLADGTDVYSEKVSADLDKEVIEIPDRFRFKREKASGEGSALEYLVNPKQVNINGAFHLVLPMNNGELRVKALKASHDLTAHTVNLIGDAQIESSDSRLLADRIDVDMTDQNKLEGAVGTGAARLNIGEGRQFMGETITLGFFPETGNLKSLRVQGAADRPGSRAIYVEQVSEGAAHRLEAAVIEAFPEEGKDQLSVKSFTADGDVVLKSQPLGIVDSRADHLVGTLAPGGKNLESADLSGKVFVMRRTPDRAGQEQEERLNSDQLRLKFAPDQTLKEALALGNVDFRGRTPASNRRLTARESVRVIYSDGQPDRADGRGDCRFEESAAGGQRRAVTAPIMSAQYRQGLLDRLRAESGVVVTAEDKEGSGISSSRTLDALYKNGRLSEILQVGDVRMRDERKASRTEVKAEQSRYDAREDAVTATGTQPPVLWYVTLDKDKKVARETETTARQIKFYRQANKIEADGAVKTILTEGADLIVVTSGRMEADRASGVATYSVSPKIIQKTGSVSGTVLRYASNDEKLTVDGEVASFLTDTSGKKYRVLSDRLDYDRRSGQARYQGNVRVSSVDLDMKAPYVDLALAEGKQTAVREVIAWGGVEIVQEGRKATGQKAVYNPDTGQVVLTAGQTSQAQ